MTRKKSVTLLALIASAIQQNYFLIRLRNVTKTNIPILWHVHATQLFFQNPLFKVVNVHATVRKNPKILLATRWSLVGARVTTFVYIYLCDTTFFQRPPFQSY